MPGAEIWIEQVRLALRSPIDRNRLAQGNDALGELVRWVDVLADDAGALDEFCRSALADVLDKLPLEVKAALAHEATAASGPGEIPRLGDSAALMDLLKDAEATLLARLNVSEAQA